MFVEGLGQQIDPTIQDVQLKYPLKNLLDFNHVFSQNLTQFWINFGRIFGHFGPLGGSFAEKKHPRKKEKTKRPFSDTLKVPKSSFN